MTEDLWLARQHTYARALGLAALASLLLYLGIGGVLIVLQSNSGAYLDASPLPEFYFAHFGELTYLGAINLFPALTVAGVAAGMSVWSTLASRHRGRIVGMQRVVWIAGGVAQAAWLMKMW